MSYLTPQERNVIVFLALVASLGIGIDLARKHWPPVAALMRPGSSLTAVDMNKATLADLVYSRRVPKKLAQKILAYRQAHGSFNDMEELRKIEGIGPRRLERIKEAFYVE